MIDKKIIIPIFPLNGVIFFPETNLPLNIFEKRYIEMIDYALAKNRTVGMIQSKNERSLYSIGCVGKITQFDATSDGRYLINLLGENLFVIKKEVFEKTKFRLFEINLQKKILIKQDLTLNKKILTKKFINFIKKKQPDINENVFINIKIEELLKLIAMSCPFSSHEKQMLLECENSLDFYQKIIALFDFYDNDLGDKNEKKAN